MPITFKDIAQRAQVSQATVSVALGSNGRIAEETRQRVLKIAKEMGYRPNLLVQGIQKGRTLTIGVLMSMAGDLFSARMFQGVHDGLIDAGCVPIVLMPTRSVSVLDQLHMLIDRRVDGVILRPEKEALWEKHLDEAIERDTPVVAINTEPEAESPQVDFVGTDDVDGGRQAAEALLAAGHRRLAVITPGSNQGTMKQRSEGFESRVGEQAGTSCVRISLPWSEEMDGYDAAKELLTINPCPMGVFVTMDQLALGVYRAANEAGINVPHDLSVIGFADNPVASTLSPGLSTMRQQPREIGERAAHLLLRRIQEAENRGPREVILLKTELVQRESVANV